MRLRTQTEAGEGPGQGLPDAVEARGRLAEERGGTFEEAEGEVHASEVPLPAKRSMCSYKRIRGQFHAPHIFLLVDVQGKFADCFDLYNALHFASCEETQRNCRIN